MKIGDLKQRSKQFVTVNHKIDKNTVHKTVSFPDRNFTSNQKLIDNQALQFGMNMQSLSVKFGSSDKYSTGDYKESTPFQLELNQFKRGEKISKISIDTIYFKSASINPLLIIKMYNRPEK